MSLFDAKIHTTTIETIILSTQNVLLYNLRLIVNKKEDAYFKHPLQLFF